MTLLSREKFNQVVQARDGNCVMCSKDATAVHHIMERKLWTDGGYYQDNGVCLCDDCHLQAEKTLISCEELRLRAGIKVVLLPPQLPQEGNIYDKWGNEILQSGIRLKGELWWEENVQKVLKEAGVLNDFLKYTKYPKTLHLPWSPGLLNDDRVIPTLEHLKALREIVVTVKYDGENTSLYHNHIHARSVDSKNHPSRNWVKALHGQIAHEIPKEFRLCGENLFAKHSIYYEDLRSYFYLFNIWERGEALSWDATTAYAELLRLEVVDVLYRGPFNEDILKGITKDMDLEKTEGFVVRSADSIPVRDWAKVTAKWVRAKHVQTDEFWMNQPVIPNQLKK